MPPKGKPTRIQPHRTAKTNSATEFPPLPTTLGGRVTKTPPKGKDKKIKTPKKAPANEPEKGTANEPGKGTTDGPNKPDADNDLTDTDNPFANGAPDTYLKRADIVVGNIISAGYHEAYTELQSHDHNYISRFVRESGDKCGHVHSKYRKFVIVAKFKSHFVSLPIYSKRFSFLDTRGDHNEYAEIIDSSLKNFSPPRLPRPQPLCRGNSDNVWLWSKAEMIQDRNWARMSDTSVAWMARPVAHANKTRAKVVSTLEPESVEQLLRWARDCLIGELEVGMKEHLRLLGKEGLVDAPIPPSGGAWGPQKLLV
ncbi:hypothetical protein V501_04694 [Pseudogymnoascus sp. VKM F-4519 (FW-2642)]|nr:hypothetical protein V501_04694 [Pseudogymnoascus sp. VKM F-4519 (FW-2642)]